MFFSRISDKSGDCHFHQLNSAKNLCFMHVSLNLQYITVNTSVMRRFDRILTIRQNNEYYKENKLKSLKNKNCYFSTLLIAFLAFSATLLFPSSSATSLTASSTCTDSSRKLSISAGKSSRPYSSRRKSAICL